MKGQDVIYFMFILILGYLLLANWKGAATLLSTAASATNSLTKTLQGR